MEINKGLFQSSEALTFDDVLVVPTYSEVLPIETTEAIFHLQYFPGFRRLLRRVKNALLSDTLLCESPKLQQF